MKIWVDVSTGTCGDADDLVIIDVSDWCDKEVTYFHEMSDDDRSVFAFEISQLQGEKNAI